MWWRCQLLDVEFLRLEDSALEFLLRISDFRSRMLVIAKERGDARGFRSGVKGCVLGRDGCEADCRL